MTSVVVLFANAQILTAQPDQVSADDLGGYVPAYAQITEALHADNPLTLIVRHPTVAAWLRAAQERYGPHRIQIVSVTARSRLAELWQVEVPAWVTDEAIIRSGLLDVSLQAQPGQTFENAVLQAFYSPLLVYDRLPVAHLADLLGNLDPSGWARAGERPLIREVLARRLQAWAERTTTEGERILVAALQSDPAALATRLAQVKVLAGYSAAVGQRTMGPEYDALASMRLDLGSLPVREADLASTVDHIRIHLNSLGQGLTPTEAVAAMLDEVSGHLVAEFAAVHGLLKSGQVDVDADMVRKVRDKFAPICDRLEQEVADLDLLVTPPRPARPDPDGRWVPDDWLQWAVQWYLPYRFWLEEIGQYDEEIASQAEAYGEWLFANYPAFRLSSPRLVCQALPGLRRRLAGPQPVLVVVVDNLNYKFYPDLARYLQAKGFLAESVTPALSMLPSCTEVSKKCLFTGQPEPFAGTAYDKPVVDAWTPALVGRRIRYVPSVGALRAVTHREHDVYLLNYTPVDQALHADEQQTGVPTGAAVRQRLRALASDIRAFSERIGAEREMVVVVLSDHGATRIPAAAPNPIDRRFYANRVIDKHHRYVTISDRELAGLPENVRFECFVFERRRFGLRRNYLAARGTYRFTGAGEDVYIHGGLSPEETVVPLAVFTPAAVAPRPLSIRLLTDELRYGVKLTIGLELANPNSYACQNVSVELLNPNVVATRSVVAEIGALSHSELQIEARIRRTGTEMAELEVRVRYEFLGQPQAEEVHLPVRMRRLMTTTIDLQDL
jgi:hypothetical protein